MLRSHASAYETLASANHIITDRFNQAIEELIRLRDKIKEPVDVQLVRTGESLDEIMKEFVYISSILNASPGSGSYYQPIATDYGAMYRLATSIISCSTVSDLINAVLVSPQPVQVDTDPGQNDLLSMIKHHLQTMQSKVYQDAIKYPYRFDICASKLDTINTEMRKQIESCYELINDVYDRHVVSFRGEESSLFSLDTNKWTELNHRADPEAPLIEPIRASAVYARGNIYVFGGEGENSNKYTRHSISLIPNKIPYSGEMIGTPGGSQISAVYDGTLHLSRRWLAQWRSHRRRVPLRH
ncbi:hypothetical protein SAMD00019534_058230 [Acytostelium subglobosum LB1]|uniref:hypothetical protein n=1 Tax=Acytostelium subglobosum LB1 TaxID=1410327 RepID=UPI000644F4DF|nr:hypothetical protein SAMD00019534_058230 [Acytostelium subglobosum LB1]GAM22648.1 hypothetical protein SAMD00019534_058230 [Acytostelium subglobosum LB1]|eukprot:XP_012754768.1 hypothetical protein SAMD00019534_058230 [Acytostelium subglobosum LB1]